MATILVIDDSREVRDVLRSTLQYLGYGVLEAKGGEEGLVLFRQHSVVLVLCDLLMPGKGGLETIRELRTADPDLKIVAMSGEGTGWDSPLASASAMGATTTLRKPFGYPELVRILNNLVPGQHQEEDSNSSA